MANQPSENTVSTSFTLPKQLFKIVKERARVGMTNQSDIVRKALMNYLTAEEREAVLKEIRNSGLNLDIETGKVVNSHSSKKDITRIAAAAGRKHIEAFRLKQKQAAGTSEHTDPSIPPARRSSNLRPDHVNRVQGKSGEA